MKAHIPCPHCGKDIAIEGLPIELQPSEVLQELALSVTKALQGDTLRATAIVDAWDYLLSIEAELERRSRLPTIEAALGVAQEV